MHTHTHTHTKQPETQAILAYCQIMVANYLVVVFENQLISPKEIKIKEMVTQRHFI